MDCEPSSSHSLFITQSGNVLKCLEKHQRGEVSKLGSHQVDAVLQLRSYFSTGSQVNTVGSNTAIVALPTGCGSDGVAVLAAYVLGAARVLVLTPSLYAAKQVYRSFSTFLVDCAVFKDEDKAKIVPSQSIICDANQIKEDIASSVMIINASKTGGNSTVKFDNIPPDGFDLVIVYEAHQYPTATWKQIHNQFPASRQLFLSAASNYKARPIIKGVIPCYELEHSEAINKGIIRDVEFDKLTGGDDNFTLVSVAIRMEYHLNNHDTEDPAVVHQGIALVQDDTSLAEAFCNMYNKFYPGKCAVYCNAAMSDVLGRFTKEELRVIVICSELLDGLSDMSSVSVVGIPSPIPSSSPVLFNQMVAKALQRSTPNDPVVAQVVTHEHCQLGRHVDSFDKLADHRGVK